ncbi:hypothetical protein Syun_028717 [Stephania yunnanensis]|uniref:Pentatricopeptide repeat-containing protein n=1 Tax=Stephania yunnanensis TaxID=152371 RepID=A0AAP0HFF5_9MAGN
MANSMLFRSLRLRRNLQASALSISRSVFFAKENIHTKVCSRSSGGCGVSLDTSQLASENEWEKLLKPFDLEELQKSLNHITPRQLCQILMLPLDLPTLVEIFEWADTQVGYSHTFDVYLILIDKLGADGQFKAIDRLLLQMKDEAIAFREELFILMMKWYGKAGFPGQAIHIIKEMKEVYGCEPTFRSYNVVLDILVAGDCPKIAVNVFYEMLNKGISPTIFTFSIVMKSYCLLNEVDSACSLLRKMTKHGCVPNSIIYQTLIHALSKDNRVNEALTLLEEMFLMSCIPDIDTFNDVMHGLCRLGRIHEAAKLVDRMLLRGFTPNALTYGPLMHGLCLKGNIDEARVLLSKVPESNVVLYNTLINGYVNIGRIDEAKHIIQEVMPTKGCGPDIFTYNILIRGFCKMGRLGSAHEMLNEMRNRDCKPNSVTYSTLIDGFCKERRLKEASDV